MGHNDHFEPDYIITVWDGMTFQEYLRANPHMFPELTNDFQPPNDDFDDYFNGFSMGASADFHNEDLM